MKIVKKIFIFSLSLAIGITHSQAAYASVSIPKACKDQGKAAKTSLKAADKLAKAVEKTQKYLTKLEASHQKKLASNDQKLTRLLASSTGSGLNCALGFGKSHKFTTKDFFGGIIGSVIGTGSSAASNAARCAAAAARLATNKAKIASDREKIISDYNTKKNTYETQLTRHQTDLEAARAKATTDQAALDACIAAAATTTAS